MRDDGENIVLRVVRRFLWIKQQNRLEIGNAAPIFHGAAEAAGDRDLIELRQRIRHAEIIVVVLKNLRRALERVASPFRFPFCRNHSDLNSTALCLNGVELARDENIQVTRHRRCRAKSHFFSLVDLRLALDRHVRDREPIFRNDRGQLKAGAKTWFIPTWK